MEFLMISSPSCTTLSPSKNGKPTISNKVSTNGKVPYVELSDGDAQQTNAMYKCNGKVLHYTASSQDKLSLSE